MDSHAMNTPAVTKLPSPSGRGDGSEGEMVALSPLRHYFRTISAIVWKDLAAELRSRELLSAMVVFALLVILIFNFNVIFEYIDFIFNYERRRRWMRR